MAETRLLAIDQGTTGTTCLLVGLDGTVHRRAYREVPVRYPRSGWVEQDALDLERSVLEASAELLSGSGNHVDGEPAAIGITHPPPPVVVVSPPALQPAAP